MGKPALPPFAVLSTVVSTFIPCALGLPVSPDDPTSEPAWNPEPQFRGTVGILAPCIITLGICVWTAIHLNINPVPTPLRGFLFKFGWLVAGIFMPEYVLGVAIGQYIEANAIMQRIIEIRRKRREESIEALAMGDSREEKDIVLGDFSMQAAFFVVMGGYAVLPKGCRGIPVTLTPAGFLELYLGGYVDEEDLEEKRIEEKVRVNGLAKGLVCVQALWLIVQGIERLASGLPLPLVELHTIMHVLCAVPMYGFWWYKPQDVGFPVILNLPQDVAEDIYSSYIYKELEPSLNADPIAGLGSKGPSESASPKSLASPPHSRGIPSDPNSLVIRLNGFSKIKGYPPPFLQSPKSFPDLFKLLYTLLWIAYEFLGGIANYRTWHRTFHLFSPNLSHPTPSGSRIIALAQAHITDSLTTNYIAKPFLSQNMRKKTFLISRARMFPNLSAYTLAPRIFDIPATFFLPIIILSTLYGAAHIGAWNSHFPTTTEKLLWRIAACVAAGYPLALATWTLGLKLLVGRFFRSEGAWNNVLKTLVALGFVLLTLVWVGARGFLVVESFISVRSLAKGSLKVVKWSNYWPHF